MGTPKRYEQLVDVLMATCFKGDEDALQQAQTLADAIYGMAAAVVEEATGSAQ